jgi:hypothetical protein
MKAYNLGDQVITKHAVTVLHDELPPSPSVLSQDSIGKVIGFVDLHDNDEQVPYIKFRCGAHGLVAVGVLKAYIEPPAIGDTVKITKGGWGISDDLVKALAGAELRVNSVSHERVHFTIEGDEMLSNISNLIAGQPNRHPSQWTCDFVALEVVTKKSA